ncbi:MAG: GNAT family N-acetyltransferase [Clostridia bacterium]|nr:GNAT family N-acetyltransferase [Clostridia bacterium]
MKVYIETDRLIIRDPVIDDFTTIWKMRNDSVVTLYTGGVTKCSKEELLKRHVKSCNNTEDIPKEYAVILKATNTYIGYCGFQYCDVLGGLEILYGFSKDHWGKGYANEAAQAVLTFGVETLGLKEIVAAVHPNNVASEKVLRHIGMAYDGEVEWPQQGKVRRYKFSE